LGTGLSSLPPRVTACDLCPGMGTGFSSFAPVLRRGARPRIGNWALLPFPPLVSAWSSVPDWEPASPLSPPHVLRRGGSVPDLERASPLLHPRVSAWVGLGPGWERASPLPPPRFGVRLGPELGTGFFSFTPPCRRGALSPIEDGPRLSRPPTCFGGGLGSGLGTGLSSFAPRAGFRLRPGLRTGLSSYMSPCASLTWIHSPRAEYYQHATFGRLRSGTNSERLSRTSTLYNKLREQRGCLVPRPHLRTRTLMPPRLKTG